MRRALRAELNRGVITAENMTGWSWHGFRLSLRHARSPQHRPPRPRTSTLLSSRAPRSAGRSRVSADALSLAKLALVPFLHVALVHPALDRFRAPPSLAIFGLIVGLDALDGLVAKGRDGGSRHGAWLDRLTDLPLFVVAAWHSADVLPVGLLVLKGALDLALLVAFAGGLGSTENRVRTAATYGLTGLLLALGQGWGTPLVAVSLVQTWLIAQVGLSAFILAHNVGLFPKRRWADALSAANLGAGLTASWLGYHGHVGAALAMVSMAPRRDGSGALDSASWPTISPTRCPTA